MNYEIILTPAAIADQERAYHWMRQHLPESAEAWYDALAHAIESLSTLPRRAPVAPESDLLGAEVRQHLLGRRPHIYRILFVIDGQKIRVLRIMHASRARLETFGELFDHEPPN